MRVVYLRVYHRIFINNILLVLKHTSITIDDTSIRYYTSFRPIHSYFIFTLAISLLQMKLTDFRNITLALVIAILGVGYGGYLIFFEFVALCHLLTILVLVQVGWVGVVSAVQFLGFG
jgi:hypothetical protein